MRKYNLLQNNTHSTKLAKNFSKKPNQPNNNKKRQPGVVDMNRLAGVLERPVFSSSSLD